MTCQSADPREDDLFTLHVDIAGRLIEDIDRAVMQERPGKRQALLLSTRQVLCVFCKLRIQPVISLAAQEFVHSALCENLPQLFIRCSWIPHEQVVSDAALEEIGLRSNVSDSLHDALLRALGEGHAVDQDGTGFHGVSTCEERSDRGFSASALSHDADKAVLGNLHVDSVQDFPLPVVGEADAL